MKKTLIIIILILVFLGLDLGTKYYAQAKLKDTSGVEVISGFWRFDYVENRNIAFSIGSQLPPGLKQPVIIAVNVFALIFLIIFLFKSEKSVLLYSSAVLIIAGALGNLIDRIINGFVIDFIHWFYKGFDWPVFNLADAYVTVGMILLITEFIFLSKHKETKSIQ